MKIVAWDVSKKIYSKKGSIWALLYISSLVNLIGDYKKILGRISIFFLIIYIYKNVSNNNGVYIGIFLCIFMVFWFYYDSAASIFKKTKILGMNRIQIKIYIESIISTLDDPNPNTSKNAMLVYSYFVLLGINRNLLALDHNLLSFAYNIYYFFSMLIRTLIFLILSVMLCYKLNNNYFDGVANVYNSLIYAFNAMCFNFVDELKHKPEYWQGGSIFMMCELNGILLLTLLLSFFVPSINQKSQIEVDKFSETIKESADDIKNRLTTKYRGTLGVAIQSIEAFSPGLKGAIRSIKKFFETEEERQLPRSRAHRRR